MGLQWRRLTTRATSRPWLVLPALAAVLGVGLLSSRRLVVGDAAASLIVFVGATVSSLVSVACLSGERWSMRVRSTLGAASLVIVLGAFAFRFEHPALGVLVDVALVGLAHAAGATIGRRVQAPGHLLPAAVVVACADLVSVLHPSGPTHAVVESSRAMNAIAFSFPVPGVFVMAPALGVGDLLFVALALGVAHAHGLSTRKMAALAIVGALVSGGVSMALERAVPALPAIGALLVLGEPAARRLEGRDRRTAIVAIVLVVAGSAGLLLRGLG